MLKMIYYSKIGPLLLESDGKYLTGLSFLKDKETKELSKLDTSVFQETIRWLDLYFSGEIPSFIPNYKIVGATPFRKKVLDILLTIPYGKTMTYKEIATSIAKDWEIQKMSAQAVGGAVGWNPIGIIIPCHRVLGAKGALTGYAGGIHHKVELLTLEGIDPKSLSFPKKVKYKTMTK